MTKRITSPEEAAALTAKAHALAALEAERGLLDFLGHVIVDAQPDKRPFRVIAEEWQWDRAARSAPAVEHLAGVRKVYTGPLSFWNGYHKGSDKTHDTAREICWLLGWSRRRLNMYVCAGDRDQAKLLTTAIAGTLRDNPWIADRVEVTALSAKGQSGSELTIMPMDAYTGQGIFPDYVVAEEVTHWQYDEGRRFWDFVLSSVNKRPHCVLKVNTNAGHIGSWQWGERNRVSKSRFWSFYEAPVGRPLPTWMNQEKIDDDSQGMDPGERDRLYKNRWVDPGEEYGYLTHEECEACTDHSLTEQPRGRRDREYFAVIDYGGVHDRAAMAVMHVEPGSDIVTVDRLDCWQGSHTDRIAINKDDGEPARRSIEGWFDVVLRNFRVGMLIVDPAQLEGLAIKYERRGVMVERFRYLGGQNNHRMAQLLKTCVQNKKIRWSPEAGLLRGAEDDTLPKELSRLVIKPMSYGYRFNHEAGRHDDRAVTLGMGLVHLLPEAPPGGSQGPTVITRDDAGVHDPNLVTPYLHQSCMDKWNIFGMGGRR